MIISLFLIAISVSDFTLASLASLFAAARAMPISRSLSAFAIAAFFFIFVTLSIPRSSIIPFESVKFCTLKLTTSKPSQPSLDLHFLLPVQQTSDDRLPFLANSSDLQFHAYFLPKLLLPLLQCTQSVGSKVLCSQLQFSRFIANFYIYCRINVNINIIGCRNSI